MQAKTSHSRVSVIIPAHQLDAQLLQCLRSIEQQSVAPLEVLVGLDNVANEHSFFQQLSYPIQVIPSPFEENRGPAVIRNLAARQAQGALLFFTDSDVALLPDTLAKLTAVFEQEPQLAAVIGSYDNAPLAASTVSRFRNLLHHYTHQQAKVEAQTFWGACGGIQKSVFEKLGGFNENYPKPCIEDIELGYRLKERGFSIRLEKSLQVKHLKRWTWHSMLYTDTFRRAKPWTELLSSNEKWSKMNDLNIKTKDKLSLVLLLFLPLGLLLLPFYGPQALVLVGLSCAGIVALHQTFYLFLLRYFSFYQLPTLFLAHLCYFTAALTGYVLGLFSYYARGPLKK